MGLEMASFEEPMARLCGGKGHCTQSLALSLSWVILDPKGFGLFAQGKRKVEVVDQEGP